MAQLCNTMTFVFHKRDPRSELQVVKPKIIIRFHYTSHSFVKGGLFFPFFSLVPEHIPNLSQISLVDQHYQLLTVDSLSSPQRGNKCTGKKNKTTEVVRLSEITSLQEPLGHMTWPPGLSGEGWRSSPILSLHNCVPQPAAHILSCKSYSCNLSSVYLLS